MMAEDRINAVIDWIFGMGDAMVATAALPADEDEDDPDGPTMREEANAFFEDKFIDGLISGFDAAETFEEKLHEAIDKMPPEKQRWFYEPDYAIETLCDIFKRYHADFSMKVALGGARYQAGERHIKNSGYRAGNALVSETTLWAYNLLSDTVCRGDSKRAVTLLGITISCALASMGKLTPDHEDLMSPQIMMVKPQVKFLPEEKRTPEYILQLIEAASAESWGKFKDNLGKPHAELVAEAAARPPGYIIS